LCRQCAIDTTRRPTAKKLTTPEPETLTDTERATLLEPCVCDHEMDDHAAMGCWGDEGSGLCECETPFEDLLVARVARIVAGRTRDTEVRALREAVADHAETFGVACATSRMWLRKRIKALEASR